MKPERGRDPLTDARAAGDEAPHDPTLRPRSLAEYVGQDRVRDNLGVFIEASRRRGTALDHVLFSGPPGLGKTTLAHIISEELGVGFHSTSGPVIERAGDLAAILTNLQERDVLFIDEIHRLSPVVEEILYPAMEDFQIDIVIGQGPAARSIKLDLARFTLVGATTRSGSISAPLRERFGVTAHLEYYRPEELERIIRRSAGILAIAVEPDAAMEIARRSRGTPRIANRLLRRVRDFAEVADERVISAKRVGEALARLDVDALGLDGMDRKILRTIIEGYGGGPVGIEAIAATLNEERGTIEDVYEPFLIQLGFIQRSARGRLATDAAYGHLGLSTARPRGDRQASLFGGD